MIKPYDLLKRFIVKTIGTKVITDIQAKVTKEHITSLITYISNRVDNITCINYIEKQTDKGIRYTYFLTNKYGEMENISYIIYFILKPKLPILKLNVKHNYIIGNKHTALEIYTRLLNYIVYVRKQQGVYKLEDKIRVHKILTYD